MRDKDYMNWDFEKEERLTPKEKLEYERIKEKVKCGFKIFEIFLWVFTGIFIGIVLTSLLRNAGINANSNVIVDGIDENVVGNYNVYSLILKDENRTIFSSRSKGKSMYPTLWGDSFQVYVRPENNSEIEDGDIIVYNPPDKDYGIVHRVIKVSEDDEGWYVYTKGDNNIARDPYRIRYDWIEGLLIGVTY